MSFYLAWIYPNFSRWNFKFFSNSDLSYGTNQDFMPFIQAQFFVTQYHQKLHSALVLFIFIKFYLVKMCPIFVGSQLSCLARYQKIVSGWSFESKNLLSFNYHTMKFHKCHHTAVCYDVLS